MRIQFLGGAGTVTGSRYLVTAPTSGALLVDCGLFQGLKQLRLRNWAPLPIDPSSVSAVVLTHAHIDHSGYLPLLVRNGFRGRIHCTAATRELCRLLLPDSAHLQEEDAEFANRHGFSKHHPALPLYTQADAERCLRQFQVVDIDEDFEVAGLRARLAPAGHILGSTFVMLSDGDCRLTFSGDLGRLHDPVMIAPRALTDTDYLIVESTYGDRLHAQIDPCDELEPVITRTIQRGGVIVVPAFAVGRAQFLLWCIQRLKAQRRIPAALPVFLDSPMAVDVTQLYLRFRAEHRLDAGEVQATCHAATYVNSVDESRRVSARRGPMILISASGMATGGRVVHHLKSFAPDPRNTILFSGYQAAGTRGAAMLAGARTIRIHGRDIPVNAEIAALSTMSAHADQGELLQWLGNLKVAPRRTFITHGEPAASDALRARIERELGWATRVPEHLASVELGNDREPQRN